MKNISENIGNAARSIGSMLRGPQTLQLCHEVGMPSGKLPARSIIYDQGKGRSQLPRHQVLHMSDHSQDDHHDKHKLLDALREVGLKLADHGHDPVELAHQYSRESGLNHREHDILFFSGLLDLLKGLLPHEDE